MNKDSQQNSAQRGSILALTIREKSVLYATYMPFLRNGGIFVPSAESAEIGQQFFLLLTLPESSEQLGVIGKVAWLTPAHAQGNRAAGIGFQFQDDGAARSKIESLLGEYSNSDAFTHTM